MALMLIYRIFVTFVSWLVMHLRSAVEGGSWDMTGRYGQVSGSWLALHR